jgi:hypothetical protein
MMSENEKPKQRPNAVSWNSPRDPELSDKIEKSFRDGQRKNRTQEPR